MLKSEQKYRHGDQQQRDENDAGQRGVGEAGPHPLAIREIGLRRGGAGVLGACTMVSRHAVSRRGLYAEVTPGQGGKLDMASFYSTATATGKGLARAAVAGAATSGRPAAKAASVAG